MPIGSQRPSQSRPAYSQPHLHTTPTSLQNVSNNNIQGMSGIWSPPMQGQDQSAAAMKTQRLLFQPGPSTLEKLLQQNRQSNK